MAGLSNLRVLTLSENQGISNIGPLSGLTNLIELRLGANQISDLGPVAGLTGLTILTLHENEISDIEPLGGLANLTELSLRLNQVNDISPLAGLTNLSSLNLRFNQVSDISALISNPGLGDGDEVDLRDNPLNVFDCPNILSLINRGVDVQYDPACM